MTGLVLGIVIRMRVDMIKTCGIHAYMHACMILSKNTDEEDPNF